MRTPYLVVTAVGLLVTTAFAQPKYADRQPLRTPLSFGASDRTAILNTVEDVILESKALSQLQTSLAAEQIPRLLDAWMSFDKATYDKLIADWGGQPRYTKDGEDQRAFEWTSNAWRTADHPFAITRVDAASFDFGVVVDRRNNPEESVSGMTCTPTFFRFDPDPVALSIDPGNPVVEFRMLAETADTETREMRLRFVWDDHGGRWLPLMLSTADFSSPSPMFYF